MTAPPRESRLPEIPPPSTMDGAEPMPPRQETMTRYFAGIDSGTQSTKVLIVSEDGPVAGRGQASYDLIGGLPVGHKEQHPDTWLDALRTAFREAVKNAGIDSREIAAIGVSGQQHGFVPLDSDDRVIRPAKLWCDTATAPEAEEIMLTCGGSQQFLACTGNCLPAGFTASKILWLRKHEPDNYRRLATVLLPHDYLNFWLTGLKRMEWGDASGTGLLDVRTREWSSDAINAIDPALRQKLPELHPSSEAHGTIRLEVARELGLREDCIVSAGGGDNMMGAIGTGNVSPGVVTVSLGTSGTVYACSEHPVIDSDRGEIAAFCDSTGYWLPLLCTMNVTVATELVKKTFGIGTDELNRAAAAVPAGANGLLLLPYFEGERTPNVPDGTGVWYGYSAHTHSAGHFARAAMEGATLGLGYGFNRMRDMGIRPTEIRLTGGGSRSALWRQILADVFATPVVCTTESEGAALGAAIQAAWNATPGRSIADLCARFVTLDESTRCEPNQDHRELYQKAQQKHNALSLALRGVFGG
jgi:xylulokinase